ncbi:MAG: 4Fe-4S binding protein [Candidatus Izemoplasmatales bacterium]|nr:4Fe-4S binding protein [Candidatus Izemoplasmatales bacterium]MDD4070116.1 4Fe-4S binding protein [Candidatus Izemoplasmatales bacterium]MDY0139576.1 4Fe-4S binding protein [Candidatus Izemoplasmatales bacterium]
MPKGRVTFNDELCKGCGLCVANCPTHILYQDMKTLNKAGYNIIRVSEPDKCIGCAFCAIMCPDSVITVEVNK